MNDTTSILGLCAAYPPYLCSIAHDSDNRLLAIAEKSQIFILPPYVYQNETGTMTRTLKNERSQILAPMLLLATLAGCSPSGTASTGQPTSIDLNCPPTTQFEIYSSEDASYQRAQHRYDLALINDTKIIQFGQSSTCEKFAAYLNRAHDETQLGKLDLAIADAKAAVDMHADDAVAYNVLALAEDNNNQPVLAMTAINQSIAADPNFAAAYVSRGQIEGALGQYQQAIADDTTAVSLSPGLTDAYVDRASMYAAQHDEDDEIADETKVISLDPNFDFAYILRSLAYHEKGQLAEAAADRETALKLDPKNAGGWNDACWLLAHADDLPEALASCEQSLTISPDNFRTLDSLGFVYLKMKNYAQSITMYDKALAAHPNLAHSLYGRGLAEQAEGDTKEATSDMQAAKALYPNVATAVLNAP
jgi:tetratricopeptide (TPR) repeat protein